MTELYSALLTREGSHSAVALQQTQLTESEKK